MNKRKAKTKQEGESKIPRAEEEPEEGQLQIADHEETSDSEVKVIQNDNQLVNDMEELGFPFLSDIPIDNLHALTKEILETSSQVNRKADIIKSFTNIITIYQLLKDLN